MASITEPMDRTPHLLANLPEPDVDPQILENFIERWKDGGGTERANYQLFLMELCDALGLKRADPSNDDTRDNEYVFERRVTEEFAEGGETKRFIDLYKRGCFVCEAKQSGLNLESGRWDRAMTKAFNQAEGYVRSLPAEEGRPPFIIVTDVGRHLEIYSEFSRSGGNYTAYPDANSFRIKLEDLRKPEIQQRLIAVWATPMELDPSRVSARVTREIADHLAELAKSLEADKYSPEQTSGFLMRCLFTMFAEDVGLLPLRSFTELLIELEDKESFKPMLENLWETMNAGGFSPILRKTILKFNGGLFAKAEAIELDREQRKLLIKAAKSDWRYVEPAIFGTLLERALDPRERHKLGAHYTPRAYVERLVFPTVIDPLRDEWENVMAAAVSLEDSGKHKEAVAEVKNFHHRLCSIRVLDPACGSGNFLYVTLEHMKRLEGDVLNLLHDLGESQGLLDMEGVTVDPHQFLGIEINPRAAKVAEMVLWIGYLQWHFRTYSNSNPPEPVLRDFHNIENRDALIEYDSRSELIGEDGKPVSIWDGLTMKTSPITGELVPDETAKIQVYQYQNPKQTSWPEADYIVGNPPFIGAKYMRDALGDGYTNVVRKLYGASVPESADFVMFWWNIAAGLVRNGDVRSFGFITTNSLKQTFNRRVLETHLNDSKNRLSLSFAIPDHPWTDATDGAAVRISMTVGIAGDHSGRLLTSVNENTTNTDEVKVDFKQCRGKLFSDLKIGADVASAKALLANTGLSSRGVQLIGSGFIVTPDEAKQLGLGTLSGLEKHIREYRNGRDLADKPRGVMVVDLFGLTQEEVRIRYPAVYQWLAERVKPGRDAKAHSKDGAGYAKSWWLFGKPRQELRKILEGQKNYISTAATAKHRFFLAMDNTILPDDALISFGLPTALFQSVLSSRIHVLWALTSGGLLGPTSRYNNSVCFETFPFPVLTEIQKEQLEKLANNLDEHRQTQKKTHRNLTLTDMYNVLEKIRKGEELTDKERIVNDEGLVGILKELHDDLDRAVFEAYGWEDLADRLVGLPGATTPYPEKSEEQSAAEEELLKRLVALNHERAAEEVKGKVRWLRPEYQDPNYQADSLQQDTQAVADVNLKPKPAKEKTKTKLTWPKDMVQQMIAIKEALNTGSQTVECITSLYKSPKTTQFKIQSALESLVVLGIADKVDDSYRLNGQ